jgi:hypothetical protein
MNARAGRRCSICAHESLAEINRALVRDRDAKSTVAVRFGVSESSVQRHRTNCLALRPKGERTQSRLAVGRRRSIRDGTGRFAHDDADGRCERCGQITGEGRNAKWSGQVRVEMRRQPVAYFWAQSSFKGVTA